MTGLIAFFFFLLGCLFFCISVDMKDKLDGFVMFIFSMFFFGMMLVFIYGPKESYNWGYNDAIRNKPLGEREHTAPYIQGHNDGKKDLEEASKGK